MRLKCGWVSWPYISRQTQASVAAYSICFSVRVGASQLEVWALLEMRNPRRRPVSFLTLSTMRPRSLAMVARSTKAWG